MQTIRETTVLFADLVGATGVYSKAGDAPAQAALADCQEVLAQAAGSCGGRVVKVIHDKVMVLVGTPDAAADAAVAMLVAIDRFPPIADIQLALGIGFHYGPVIQKDEDVFGDTVNLASRLVEQAAKSRYANWSGGPTTTPPLSGAASTSERLTIGRDESCDLTVARPRRLAPALRHRAAARGFHPAPARLDLLRPAAFIGYRDRRIFLRLSSRA